eukprot:6267592-Alexandrium_andersonii.AAC.1
MAGSSRCSGPSAPSSTSPQAVPRRRPHRVRHPALPQPRGLRGWGPHGAARLRRLPPGVLRP